jgi:hypothetical protein
MYTLSRCPNKNTIFLFFSRRVAMTHAYEAGTAGALVFTGPTKHEGSVKYPHYSNNELPLLISSLSL